MQLAPHRTDQQRHAARERDQDLAVAVAAARGREAEARARQLLKILGVVQADGEAGAVPVQLVHLHESGRENRDTA